MTDLQLLFAVLAVLYFWECACWVRRGTALFRTWLGGRWRLRHPGVLLGNQRGGFVFAPPLPPLGTVLVAAQFPFSIGPEGVLAFVSSSANPGGRPAQTGRFLPWAEVQEVKWDAKKVLVNRELFVSAGSVHIAAFLADELRKIQEEPQAGRSARISSLIRKLLDSAAVASNVEAFRQRTRWIPTLTNALFAYLFGVAPLVIWRFGFTSLWPALLAALLVFTSLLAWLFRRAHRVLYPEAEDERFTHCLIVLLSPTTAIRARDLLSRPLLECSHPLAAAQALCSETEFRDYAQLVWRELKYPAQPVCPSSDPAALATERYWRETMLLETERFLRENKVDPASLLRVPEPNETDCVAYCPRCLAQYTTAEGACADCGGVELIPFEPRHADAK